MLEDALLQNIYCDPFLQWLLDDVTELSVATVALSSKSLR
jgi:hypothetical protein